MVSVFRGKCENRKVKEINQEGNRKNYLARGIQEGLETIYYISRGETEHIRQLFLIDFMDNMILLELQSISVS